MSSAYLNAGARLDDSGTYRYALSRRWAPEGTRACFLMLNPSTADGQQDDPTIRRCVAFARAWGHSALVVVNLFAFRATDPRELRKVPAPVGPENDASILAVVQLASVVVAAWGVNGALQGRGDAVAELVSGHTDVHVLRLTKHGHPEHPLYLPGELTPQLWKPRRQAVQPKRCPCGQKTFACAGCGACQATGHAACACKGGRG